MKVAVNASHRLKRRGLLVSTISAFPWRKVLHDLHKR
ncbi:MAG: hypothetical protein K0R28_6085, partial [Paenibacillus sp.]|nr:hypothetical protein [Paenibacillus sp.]